MEPIHPGGAITPRLASKYPPKPAIVARKPITRSNSDIGRRSSLRSILLREPTLAANASSTPKNAPIHQVAMTPQPRASSAGDVVENTGGWKTEKYSTQMWAVNWSWMMPYSTAANTQVTTILNDCIPRDFRAFERECKIIAENTGGPRTAVLRVIEILRQPCSLPV